MSATKLLTKSAPATMSMLPQSGMPLSQLSRPPNAEQSKSHTANSFGEIRGARMVEGLTCCRPQVGAAYHGDPRSNRSPCKRSKCLSGLAFHFI